MQSYVSKKKKKKYRLSHTGKTFFLMAHLASEQVSSSTSESLGLMSPMLTECASTTVSANPNSSFTTCHLDAKTQLQDVLYSNCFQVAWPRSTEISASNQLVQSSVHQQSWSTHSQERTAQRSRNSMQQHTLAAEKLTPPFILLSTDAKRALIAIKREHQKREPACWIWSAQPAGWKAIVKFVDEV